MTTPHAAAWERGPLVSIVTPSYNQARFLEQTILSVLNQDYPHIEYIIIDGGSTDGSVDIIKRYAHQLAYWVSEPDRGQSHAINKGWQRARGEVVAYLNSDDLYTKGAVSRAVQALNADPATCMVYSDALVVDERGRALRTLKGRPFTIKKQVTTDGLIPQPTVFLRMDALRQVGFLDERLHMVMDYDLWTRLGLNYPATYLPQVRLAVVREHASAKSTAEIAKFPAERRQSLAMVLSGADLSLSNRRLRREIYASLHYQDAKMALGSQKPRLIAPSLLRAFSLSPAYVLKRPLAYYLCLRAMTPWWSGSVAQLFA